MDRATYSLGTGSSVWVSYSSSAFLLFAFACKRASSRVLAARSHGIKMKVYSQAATGPSFLQPGPGESAVLV